MRPIWQALIIAIIVLIAEHGASVGIPQQPPATMQSMSVADLERTADTYRAQKNYEEAITYFKEAIRRDPKNAHLYNKLGLAELSLGDYVAARSEFARATKLDHTYPEAWNDLGVVSYIEKKYGAAARYFQKAITLDESRASFHVNLGVTWFTRNNMEKAMKEYTRALEIDPEALARNSASGVSAQILSREERAKQEYLMAKVFAKMGNVDSCLVCLKKAKEEGYSDLANVYKDEEFSQVRQDTRLSEIIPPPTPK